MKKRDKYLVVILCCIALCSCFESRADNLFISGQVGFGGKVISIDSKYIKFDLKCTGAIRSYKLSEYSGMHFNDRCGNKRVDAVGGDENGCPYDKNGDRTDIGAKKYVLVVTKRHKYYALSELTFDNDELRGKLLLSNKTVTITRSELDAVSPQEDCDFTGTINK